MRVICQAIGCAIRLHKPGQVMCPCHWSMLPPNVQAALADSYSRDQWRTKRYSPHWRVALVIAVNHVGLLEGMMTRDQADERERIARETHGVY